LQQQLGDVRQQVGMLEGQLTAARASGEQWLTELQVVQKQNTEAAVRRSRRQHFDDWPAVGRLSVADGMVKPLAGLAVPVEQCLDMAFKMVSLYGYVACLTVSERHGKVGELRHFFRRGHRPGSRSKIDHFSNTAQRFVTSSGAMRVKPFSGNRSETAAAINRMAPALPKAIQWVPKVS
jgi:hypothetical protein